MSQLDQALLNCLAERRASSACGMSAQSKHPEDVLPGNSVSGSSLETFLLKSFVSWTRGQEAALFLQTEISPQRHGGLPKPGNLPKLKNH